MSLAVLSCKHVSLQVASPASPVEERVVSYEQQKSQEQSLRRLQLAGGSAVYHVEDLLAVLPEEVKSAKAAKKSQKLFIPAIISSSAMLSLGVVMVSFFASGGVQLKQGSEANDEATIDLGVKRILIGVGFGVGLFPGGIITRHYAGGWAKSRRQAFSLYNKDLKAQLQLCEENGALGECPSAP